MFTPINVFYYLDEKILSNLKQLGSAIENLERFCNRILILEHIGTLYCIYICRYMIFLKFKNVF